MWTDLVRVLPRFSSAVLTFRDAGGYPFSVRCHPRADDATQSFTLEISDHVPVCPGLAGMLWHLHDERLWNQLSYTTRGHLEQAGTEWR